MAKVNSEEYNKALEEYLKEGIGWNAGMFDINAKNNKGDYEQFAADSFHSGWKAANESEGKCNICSIVNRTEIDFNEFREVYFKEHVSHKTTDGIPVVCTHPHNLFEWFKAKIKGYDRKTKDRNKRK